MLFGRRHVIFGAQFEPLVNVSSVPSSTSIRKLKGENEKMSSTDNLVGLSTVHRGVPCLATFHFVTNMNEFIIKFNL